MRKKQEFLNMVIMLPFLGNIFRRNETIHRSYEQLLEIMLSFLGKSFARNESIYFIYHCICFVHVGGLVHFLLVDDLLCLRFKHNFLSFSLLVAFSNAAPIMKL